MRACIVFLAVLAFCAPAWAEDAGRLRLVPFPKEVELRGGTLTVDRDMVLEVPQQAADVLGRLVTSEMMRAGLPAPEVRREESDASLLRLFKRNASGPRTPPLREQATPEDYALVVGAGGVVGVGKGQPGLFYAAETLCQLIRANRRGNALPRVAIRDWPSLRWRCFQDDMTRGPSSTLATLKQQVDIGAALKMNLFTYYMEYQYAFKKHPEIGPKDGSLTPEDLATLVAYGRPRHVDILGNQQSFGHFEDILKHEQYAALRETPHVLCPVKEESYRLLDDLYSEVCPLLPFAMFNVCCDETYGLGTGPSKPLAEKIGTGGVYVRHVRRIHDLLKEKYHKRMMMWGDIILRHPDKLDQIPKDTVMLTWGYAPKESFEDQIVPFARSAYDFFVCPGISNWSRILPDFGASATNIRNFVRDGAAHGAIGMLNTAWEDDGEALQGYKWYGYAWGAECAWNASATDQQDFDRRIGAALFGEKDDHFGRAVQLLAQTHRLDGMGGMHNRRFWKDDRPAPADDTAEANAKTLLVVVEPAIEHLEACRKDATWNASLLEDFLFGARRMERIGRRTLDAAEAARAYAEAARIGGREALPHLAEAEKLLRAERDAHAALGREFKRRWLAESKPYALDWTMRRYAATVRRYDGVLRRLGEAHAAAQAGKALPPPERVGLSAP